MQKCIKVYKFLDQQSDARVFITIKIMLLNVRMETDDTRLRKKFVEYGNVEKSQISISTYKKNSVFYFNLLIHT